MCTGSPRREFLHASDLSRAVLVALQSSLSDSLLNVGSGSDISIDNSHTVQSIIEHEGEIDGTQQNRTEHPEN